jgi:hypothetical protein
MFIFVIWLTCFFVTIYILGKREQLNCLTVFLAFLFWPLALVVALMVPADAMKPNAGPPISENERPLSERLTIEPPVKLLETRRASNNRASGN